MIDIDRYAKFVVSSALAWSYAKKKSDLGSSFSGLENAFRLTSLEGNADDDRIQ